MYRMRPEIHLETGPQAAVTAPQALGDGRIFPTDGLQHFTDGFPAGHHFVVAGCIAAQDGRYMNGDDGSFAEHDAPPFGCCP